MRGLGEFWASSGSTRPLRTYDRLLDLDARCATMEADEGVASMEPISFAPLGEEHEVVIPVGAARLAGTLAMPPGAQGIVVFAHGSGSTRHSPRNRFVANALRNVALGTLLFDLLTPTEAAVDALKANMRFDIGLLAERLEGALGWLAKQEMARGLPMGCFGASTGAAAALVAAAHRPGLVKAVVSRGGRPDLAGAALTRVQAPTLLIVGGDDLPVIGLNRRAMSHMRAAVTLEVVPNAGHLFEERGALEEVAALAARWFERHLAYTLKPSSTPPDTV
jgi:putative phosphoribosyl transferase